jgi:2-iminobutanoate/2-iminopropanoate deaminase
MILEEHGMGMDDIIKTRIYLADMDDFVPMNTVYCEFFKNKESYPARVCVAMHQLPKQGLVEIECEVFKALK